MPEAAPQVVILAGGLATRLRPLTHRLPKALVPIGGRPFLEYQLDWLQAAGVRDIVILLGHLGEQIIAFIRDAPDRGLSVRFHYDGGSLLGTGGALRGSLGLLDPAFMVLNGDTLLDLNLPSFWSAFKESGDRAGLVVGSPSALDAQPNVAVRGQDVEVYDATALDPRCSLAHLGVCAFQSEIVAELGYAEVADLGRLVSLALDSGPVLAWRTPALAFDIGTPQGLARFESHLRQTGRLAQQESALVG